MMKTMILSSNTTQKLILLVEKALLANKVVRKFPHCSLNLACLLAELFFKLILPCLLNSGCSFNRDMRVDKLICHRYFQNLSMCRQPPSRYRSFSSFLPSTNELVGQSLVRLLAMQWPLAWGAQFCSASRKAQSIKGILAVLNNFCWLPVSMATSMQKKSKRRLSLAQGFYSNITKALLSTI